MFTSQSLPTSLIIIILASMSTCFYVVKFIDTHANEYFSLRIESKSFPTSYSSVHEHPREHEHAHPPEKHVHKHVHKRVHEPAVLVEEQRLIATHTLDYDSCNASNSIFPETWCVDTHKIPHYTGNNHNPLLFVPKNTIQHYTHEGYQHCLANKTVVFIGESRVRYQFMHLASLLLSQKPLKCEDYLSVLDNTNKNNTFTPDPNCFLINEYVLHTDWNTWFQKSDEAFKPTSTSSRDVNLCDCYRPQETSVIESYENRFIRISTPFGDITLIYLLNFRDLIRLNEKFPPYTPYAASPSSNSSTSTRCKTGECGNGNRTNAFEGTLNETLWNVLPLLNATHAFVNMGWWPWPSDFSCELQEFQLHHPEIKTFLMTDPPHVKHLGNTSATFDPKRLKCNIPNNILDRSTMTGNVPRGWYWDKMHVYSILNEAYNHVTVEKICPL